MAETTLQLGFVPKERGNYTSGTNYYKDNVVQYNGSSYIADPVGWSEDHPTDTYVTIAPTDASGNLNAGWRVFASGNNTFTTGEKVDNVGIDDEPTAESNNLVKSGGVTKTIRDKVYVNKDASSLIGEWVVDGNAITFESSDGMNGTFTSHTDPDKPARTRPYFRFQGFENGKKYRLRLHAVVNSIRTNKIEFLYCNGQAATWSEENKMRDADSGNSANVYSGKSLDCVFVANSSKTFILFTMRYFGIDESVTISEFSIEELSGINDVYADINVNTNNIATLQTDVIKARTNVNKFGFVGKGATYVSSEYYHLLQKGHTYRIHVINDVWEDPEGTTSSQYKFLFGLVKDNAYIRYITPRVNIGDTVIRDYIFTMPYEDNEYDFLRIGGRANEGVEISLLFDDITDILKSQIQYSDTWVKHFGKDDYYYKARLNTSGEESTIGTNYTYIFRVNDIIHISALIDDDYKMLIGLYSDFDGAKKDTTAKRLECIGDMAQSIAVHETFFKYGDSTIKAAYMAIKVSRADDIPITDTDIENIENSLELSFYPIGSIGQINDIQKDIVDINGSSITLNNLELYTCDSNGYTYGAKTRLKFFYQNIKAGKKVSIDISNALQEVPLLVYGCNIHSDLFGAKKNKYASILQSVVSSWTSNNTENAVITVGGVFSLYFKKSDDSAFTYEEIIAVKNTLSVTIVPDTSEVEDEGFDGYDELPLGSFHNSSTTLVESNYTTCVPYLGIKYKFMLPSDIKARVSYGNYSLTTQTAYAVDGEIVSLSGTGMVQMVQFAKIDSSALDYSIIEDHITNGRIKVYYKRLDLPIEERNNESETYVKAAMLRLKYADDADAKANGGLHSMPVIVHSSDFHGDMKRFENFVDYAHYLNADSIISTGDNVLYASSHGTLYMKDVITKKSGIPFLNCIGNHECWPKETYDNEYLFNNHIAPYITQGNYLSAANTPATMPYYYVDLAENSLRIIIINQYDNACYYGAGLGGRLGQTQVTWLCNTLLSTPEGYGVIVGMHANETKVNTPTELAKWNQTVNWDGGNEDTSGYCVNGLYVNAVRPIRMIIDAFISKTQLNTTYDENTINGNNGETVTINVDFSNVANGVEFICYLTGHRHKDNVGYVDGATNLQLMLNVVCGNCHYSRDDKFSFSEDTDLPRGDRGVTQDAFNVYAIDRKNGNVKIARVGSSVNFEGIERKFLIAPYKSNS